MISAYFRLICACALAFSCISTARADLDEDLIKFAKPYKRTLSRGVHVYHWAPAANAIGQHGKIASVDSRDERVLGYVGFLKELFWAPKQNGGMAGNGVYVSIDPVATNGYGGWGDNWLMVQTIVPKGTRFLEISNVPSFPSDIAGALSKKGCHAQHINSLFSQDYMEPCRKARNAIVWGLDVMAVRYSYSAASFKFCASRDSQSALVLFDDRSLNWDRMIVLTSHVPDQDRHHENRLIINTLFRETTYSTGRPTGFPWPSLKDHSPKTNVAEWSGETLMGCGDFEEDK